MLDDHVDILLYFLLCDITNMDLDITFLCSQEEALTVKMAKSLTL